MFDDTNILSGVSFTLLRSLATTRKSVAIPLIPDLGVWILPALPHDSP